MCWAGAAAGHHQEVSETRTNTTTNQVVIGDFVFAATAIRWRSSDDAGGGEGSIIKLTDDDIDLQ